MTGRVRLIRLLTALGCIATLLLMSVGAMAVGESKVAIPSKDTGYRYKVVTWGSDQGFQAVGYDDSGWSAGTAAFGTTSGPCTFQNPTDVKTFWPINTDLLVRKEFTLPAGANNLRITGTIDNDATLYINGVQLGNTVTSGNCAVNAINVVAPDALLVAGTNLLAIRGHDYGVSTYLDVQVTYDDAPVYSICTLYDQTKAHKSGSTVPVKLQLCDSTGANLSSASIVVHATGLTKTDATASSSVEDSGSANPDDGFRYDSDLGGYIFNLSTKGLSTGTWVLSFTVDGEVESSYGVKFDVK